MIRHMWIPGWVFLFAVALATAGSGGSGAGPAPAEAAGASQPAEGDPNAVAEDDPNAMTEDDPIAPADANGAPSASATQPAAGPTAAPPIRPAAAPDPFGSPPGGEPPVSRYGSGDRSVSGGRTGFGGRDRSDRSDRGDRSRYSGGGSFATSQPAGITGDSFESYQVISSQNIFVKDRRPRPTFTPSNNGFIPRPAPYSVVLTGIGLLEGDDPQESQTVAFFEDSRTGGTTRATIGQALDGGKIVAISLDSVEYEKNGTRRRITVGRDLAGAVNVVSASGSMTRPADTASTQPTTGPSTGDPAVDAIMERLRQKRALEMRQ